MKLLKQFRSSDVYLQFCLDSFDVVNEVPCTSELTFQAIDYAFESKAITQEVKCLLIEELRYESASIKLNDKELLVLRVLFEQACGDCNIGDDYAWFTDLSDVEVTGLSRKQIGGYISDLKRKGLVFVNFSHNYGESIKTIVEFKDSTVKDYVLNKGV